MKKFPFRIAIPAIAIPLCFILLISGANTLLTQFMENSNLVCNHQTFNSSEEAIQAMEANERENKDTSLDYCPPYEVLHTFDYEKNTIILYSYCYSFDGKQSNSYAIRILKHNTDGTLSFDSGFADFRLTEPVKHNDYYFFTNIQTPKGIKSISFLYLPKDSDKDVYVDGKKAEKQDLFIFF